MSEYHKQKKFLELPRYGGGNVEFRKFIAANLQYPKEALEARIEGRVLVEYEIDDNGFVHNPRILRGIGYGCDEEALRIVKMLRYKKVKNRGVRVRVNTKTNIAFRLPTTSISYTVSPAKKEEPSPQQEPNKPVVYEYVIKF
jgi:TonB family protein